jgi:hypothetical protein
MARGGACGYAGGMSAAKAKKGGGKTAQDSVEEIASVRIELAGSEPLIWRAVEVPTSITLRSLHDVIQVVMEWFDCHLWEFTAGDRRYGPRGKDDPWEGSEDAPADAAKVRLRDVLRPGRTGIGYIYDFGDGWEHRLTVRDVRPGAADAAYPRYVAGAHAAPPEDCGGLPGFYEMLSALADPDHPDHAEIAAWLEDYDPHEINALRIKYGIGRIAARRRAARNSARKRAGG